MANIGILDPLGENLNPLNDKSYSEQYKELSKKWSKLPAYKKAEDIIENIKSHQVILIISSTGSGKSVLIPKFVLHTLNYKGKIAMTLPKQITAKSAAEYAARTLDVELGEEIGYQYKGSDPKGKSNRNKILYATDGTIVAKLLRDPYLREFDAVVADEIHERKVSIDFLLYLLKNTLKLRPEFKVILMSATINEKIFESYFATYKYITINVGGERNFPIESKFLKTPINQKEYLAKGYDIIKEIVKSDNINSAGSHDIIYFITSISEAMDICKKVNEEKLDIYCIEVYSGMDQEKEQLALDKEKYKIKSGKGRKLIMGTGVAESSLTFDGIKYVIDSGYELYGYYDPNKDAKVLEKRMISQAQAYQRLGRSGRTEPGICYHLYTEEEFNKMEKYPEPTIRTSNIYQECLKLISYPHVETLKELLNVLSEFIEPPRERYVTSAIEQLQNLKLVNDTKITDFGKIIGELQTDPRMGVAIYYSKLLQCSNEVIAILATIESSKNNISELFRIPEDTLENTDENNKKTNNINKKFENSISKFKNQYGDHMVIYKIINEYARYMKDNNQEKINDYTYKYFLKKNVLDKAYKNSKKYKLNMRRIKYNIMEKEIKDYDLKYRVLGCIAYAYKDHIGYLHGNTYKTKLAENLKPNRKSFINMQKELPNKIYYHELFNNNGRLEINIVSNLTSKIEEIMNIIDKQINNE